ncbi:MAG: flavin reductase [Proteobacteria bacterium]|nr:flavin reductase [Pseudomonadota bacterium]HQR04390.1 flavin reductase [Rhodocyclaceae bacterium]
MSSPSIDARSFRSALGSFATGVTVITTRSEDGSAAGLTANSFNSVSLEPPMVLWSLAKSSRSMPAFQGAKHWAVHVLAADQEPVSKQFATAGIDKFAGLTVETGVANLPLLAGCAARFQCKMAFQYDGGDHIIFVGEVLDFDRSERPPLLYHAGKYALAAQKGGIAEPRGARLAGSFSEDYLGYLLGRAHYQFYAPVHAQVVTHGLTDDEYFVLSVLTIRNELTASDLSRQVGFGPYADQAMLDRMAANGLLNEEDGHYSLTPKGRDITLHIMAAAKAREMEVLGGFGEADAIALKTLLLRLVKATLADYEDLWPSAD